MSGSPRSAASVTVDVVALSVPRHRLEVLLVRRGRPPYEDRWALPGGFVEPDEDLASAAVRELEEETAVRLDPGRLGQLATYGDPGRDPRGRTVSVVHLALLPEPGDPRGGDDASEARWWPVETLGGVTLEAGGAPELAFDHGRILADALGDVGRRLEQTGLATDALPGPFTVDDLRRVYEAVWRRSLDPISFRRAVLSAEGFLVPEAGAGAAAVPGAPPAGGTAAPAPAGTAAAARDQRYRRGPAARLHPPLSGARLGQRST